MENEKKATEPKMQYISGMVPAILWQRFRLALFQRKGKTTVNEGLVEALQEWLQNENG